MTKARKLWLKLLVCTALVGTLTGAAAGYLAARLSAPVHDTTPSQERADGDGMQHFDTIYAHKIMLSQEGGGPTSTVLRGDGMCIYSALDIPRAILTVKKQNGEWSPSLNFYDMQKRNTLSLASLPQGPSMYLTNPRNKSVFTIVPGQDTFRMATENTPGVRQYLNQSE